MGKRRGKVEDGNASLSGSAVPALGQHDRLTKGCEET